MEEITAENNRSLVRKTRLRSDSLNAAIPHMNQSANYWTESINLYISFFVSSVHDLWTKNEGQRTIHFGDHISSEFVILINNRA